MGHDEKGALIKRVLNVGGNSKAISLPPQYAEFEHILLDIDPNGSPDIVCDARHLTSLQPGLFSAVYCSHNLEHYYRHDVPKVLSGFLHVLEEGGFAHIRVPDIQAVMSKVIEDNLDLEDTLYTSPAGPIMVLDVLYGYGIEIERSGQGFFAHKTGFSKQSLLRILNAAGFSKIYSGTGNFEIGAIAFKGQPNPAARALFALPEN